MGVSGALLGSKQTELEACFSAAPSAGGGLE